MWIRFPPQMKNGRHSTGIHHYSLLSCRIFQQTPACKTYLQDFYFLEPKVFQMLILFSISGHACSTSGSSLILRRNTQKISRIFLRLIFWLFLFVKFLNFVISRLFQDIAVTAPYHHCFFQPLIRFLNLISCYYTVSVTSSFQVHKSLSGVSPVRLKW